MIKFIIRLLFVLVLAASLSPVVASAQKSITIGPTIPKKEQVFGGGLQDVGRIFSDPQILVANIFKIAIAISGAIFLVLFLVGGLRYLTASGDEENTGKAKKVLIDAIVGLLIVLAAWAAGTWILGKFGLGPETSVTTGGGSGVGGINTGGGGTGSGSAAGGGTFEGDGGTQNLTPKDAGYRDGLDCGRQGRDKNDCFSPDYNYDIQRRKQYSDAYEVGYNEGIQDATISPSRPSDTARIVDAKAIPISDFANGDKRQAAEELIRTFSQDCARNKLGTPKVKWSFPVVRLECWSKFNR